MPPRDVEIEELDTPWSDKLGDLFPGNADGGVVAERACIELPGSLTAMRGLIKAFTRWDLGAT